MNGPHTEVFLATRFYGSYQPDGIVDDQIARTAIRCLILTHDLQHPADIKKRSYCDRIAYFGNIEG
ncbi:hypothetical protein CKA34_02075 [Rhizobium sp. 11515TR]|nr:hypothetical protein CKA34_02075 [Rhizobium sp. 11515TR]